MLFPLWFWLIWFQTDATILRDLTESGRIRRVGDPGLFLPVFHERVQPDYPPQAQNSKAEGFVVLEIVLKADGTIGDYQVLHRFADPSLGFEQATMDAFRQWKWSPAEWEGQPVDCVFRLKMDFQLE
ncbi:MAG: energy transducer TonB [Acidobacteria bacterium]|nr:energy transducer TonB [Acidobacteriota bacterium]MCB9396469.1 energy transducer TonB [Acidobacteriota bacterium]